MKRRSLLKFLGLVPVMGASALSASKVEAKEFELPKMTNYGIDNIKEINLKELRRRVDQLYDKLMPETTYRPDPGFKAQLAKTIMRDICFPAKHDRIQHIRLVIDESDYNGRSALFQTVPSQVAYMASEIVVRDHRNIDTILKSRFRPVDEA